MDKEEGEGKVDTKEDIEILTHLINLMHFIPHNKVYIHIHTHSTLVAGGVYENQSTTSLKIPLTEIIIKK